ARTDGDPIYAVIRGSAQNHAGGTTSLLAPNFPMQVHAVVQAYQRSNISPDTVTLVVAHGTGTEAAGALELKMFQRAFSHLSPSWPGRARRCAVACLKPNFGHLESASGIAGVMLAIQAMRHQCVPGLAGLAKGEPRRDGEGSPFILPAEPMPWEAMRDKNSHA